MARFAAVWAAYPIAELQMVAAELKAAIVAGWTRAKAWAAAALAVWFAQTRTNRKAGLPATMRAKAFSWEDKQRLRIYGSNKRLNCQNCHDCQNRRDFFLLL